MPRQKREREREKIPRITRIQDRKRRETCSEDSFQMDDTAWGAATIAALSALRFRLFPKRTQRESTGMSTMRGHQPGWIMLE